MGYFRNCDECLQRRNYLEDMDLLQRGWIRAGMGWKEGPFLRSARQKKELIVNGSLEQKYGCLNTEPGKKSHNEERRGLENCDLVTRGLNDSYKMERKRMTMEQMQNLKLEKHI